MSNQYIYIETYGCTANKNNSEIIAGILTQSGYLITNNIQLADFIIINTCIVKQKTESKIKRRIQDLSNEYANKTMIISGCMPETDFLQLKKINNNLLLLGIGHIKEITKLIKDFKEDRLTKQKQEYYLSKKKEEKILCPKIPENKLVSIAQISEGCLGECTYCNTRFAKGTLFSYPQEKILKSIENDLSQGAKEIWITSQDNASYGLDRGKNELPELINKILSLSHNFKLRLGMMNPNNLHSILDKMIEVYKNKKIYKFLHIPVQSASDKILKDMNRLYKIEVAEEIIKKFKKEFPDITISTDLIIGYPTETDEDHKKNLEFLKNFKPDVLNISKFSSHKQTKAGELITLKKEIINKRSTEIMDMHKSTAQENKIKFLNQVLRVFVNVKVPVEFDGTLSMLQNSNRNFGHTKTNLSSIYESRDKNYNIVFINSSDKSILGKNIEVKIKKIGVHYMFGEIVEGKVKTQDNQARF